MLTHNYPRFEGDFAGVFISLLARRLPECGIEPVIVAPHAPGTPEFEEMDGVKVYRFRYAAKDEDENLAYHGSMHKLVLGSVSGIFRFKSFLDSFRKAANQIISKEGINALAGHWLVPSGMVMKTINKGRNLPTFMYSHGTDVRLARKYFRALYRYLSDFCLNLDGWTVVSNYLKEEMVALDPRLKNRIEVLPIPHDETVFFRDESVIRDENLVVAVTRFTKQKRFDYLLRAFARVLESRPQSKLELYAGGPLRSDADELIARFGLSDRVAIHDPVPQPELRDVYNKAAVVVLNSVEEGFGLALSEAMLCGTAVIGANSGGIVDIIEHEKTGLLVEADNTDSLAEALLRLLEERLLRGRLASAGHEYATGTYASAALAGRYAEIIKRGLVHGHQ
ncbi:MAG: glycosyltransferase family 4 protein [Candidatus Zixiibacteriota bacterium]|nr:MAG: glycosyltransferase family 4 protein [candidate division Zixibacteria bacterium]